MIFFVDNNIYRLIDLLEFQVFFFIDIMYFLRYIDWPTIAIQNHENSVGTK